MIGFFLDVSIGFLKKILCSIIVILVQYILAFDICPSLMWYVSNTFFYVTKNSWKPIILFLTFDLYEMHDTARNMSLIFLWYFENIKIIRFKMQRHENIRCWSSRIPVTNRSHEFGKISYIIKNISKAIFLEWEIKFCDRAAIKYVHIYTFISAIWISVSDLSQSHFLL